MPIPKARLLIIEDHVDLAVMFQMMLRLMGYHSDIAYDGVAGLQMARDLLPDLIICDIGLPELDGYGVAAGLRASKETSSIPLIAVTAYGEEAHDAIIKSGFLMHLIKPVDPRVLQNAISIYTAA